MARTALVLVLTAVATIVGQGLGGAVELVRDYPIRIVTVAAAEGAPAGAVREVVQVNTGSEWVAATEFVTTNVAAALGADPADLPPHGSERTLRREVPIRSSAFFIEEPLSPVWLRVVARDTAPVTGHQSHAAQAGDATARRWQWTSHFVSQFLGWIRVDQPTGGPAATVPVSGKPTVTPKPQGEHFLDP